MIETSYVGRFRKLADRESGGNTFRRELLELLVRTTDATGGRLWNRDSSARWLEADDIRTSGSGLRSTVASPHPASLDAVWQKRQTLFVGEEAATSVLHPIQAAGDTVVELTFAAGSTRNTQHIRQVLAVAHATAERHALLDEQRRLQSRVERVAQERNLCEGLLACEDSATVAGLLANDARVMIGADRVGVWLRSNGRLRLEALSGQDAVNTRTDVVEAMTPVVAEALEFDKLAATGPQALVELDERSAGISSWPSYREQFAVRSMHVARLVVGKTSDAGRGEVLGAVVAEYFEGTPVCDDLPGALAGIANAGARALSRFAPAAGRRPGRRLRRWYAAAVLAIGALLSAVEVPADISCQGVLEPAERQHVFAPSGGTVEEIFVAAGDRVTEGQPLLRLRSVELDASIAQLQGELASGDQRLDAIKRLRTMAPHLQLGEENRLNSEAAELRAKLDSVERQLTLRREEQARLTIVAPTSGTVSTADLQELLNRRPVAGGQVLLTLCRLDGPWRLELRVAESDGGLLGEGLAAQPELDVTFSSTSDPFTDHKARLQAMPLATRFTPEAGSYLVVHADCRSEQGPYDGGEVVARIHAGSESLGSRLFGGIARVIRHRILFRWI